MIDLTFYEIARRNMVAFAEHYIIKDNMTKKEWFNIQKKVLKELKLEIKGEKQ